MSQRLTIQQARQVWARNLIDRHRRATFKLARTPALCYEPSNIMPNPAHGRADRALSKLEDKLMEALTS